MHKKAAATTTTNETLQQWRIKRGLTEQQAAEAVGCTLEAWLKAELGAEAATPAPVVVSLPDPVPGVDIPAPVSAPITVEDMEQEARRRAVYGVLVPIYWQGDVIGTERRYSDALLMFLLKAERPEKYLPARTVRHDVSVKLVEKFRELPSLAEHELDQFIRELEGLRSDSPEVWSGDRG